MSETDCKGCHITVRLAAGEVDRILAEYLAGHAEALVDDRIYADRLSSCDGCPDLRYGTTCRHCGCFVAVRAKVAGKSCAAPEPKWPAV